MSTRSIIIVTGLDHYGRKSTFRLYKHSDGYPTGTLDVIRDALKDACKIVMDDSNETRAHYKRPMFKNIAELQSYVPEPKSYESIAKLSPSLVAGKLIGHGAHEYGMGIRLEKEYSGQEFNPSIHAGNQGDLEWIYIIDLQACACNVFGGGYIGAGPMAHLESGFVNPTEYADQLRAECQAGERAEIESQVRGIKKLGFTVNKKAPKRLTAKQ